LSHRTCVEGPRSLLRKKLERVGKRRTVANIPFFQCGTIGCIDLGEQRVVEDETGDELRNSIGEIDVDLESIPCEMDGGLEQLFPGEFTMTVVQLLPG